MSKPKCLDCIYSAHSVVRGYESLTCHRYAPHPLAGGSGTGWSDFDWPVVGINEFCGEFKSREVGDGTRPEG